MVRHLALVCLLFGVHSFASAQEVLFRAHPQINEKVGQFTESLILALAPEFEKGAFKYDLSRTDLGKGLIYARFDGVTSKTEIKNLSTPMVIGTDLIFKITHENDKEYALNLDLIGQISDTRTVIDFLNLSLKPKCLENSAMAGDSQSEVEQMCAIFSERFSDISRSAVDNFELLVEEWKKQILFLIENKAHTLKGNTESVLKDYINEQIFIERSGDKLFVQVNLEEIGSKLAKEDKEMVKALKLDIMRINKFQMLVSERVIEYDISVTKLHSKSTINKMVDFGQGFQNTIEDKEAGKKIGEGLRQTIKGDDLGGVFSIMMGANKADAAWAAGRVVTEKAGEAASNALDGLLGAIGLGKPQNETGSSTKTQDEEDLGL